jgi:hypothetical protein
MQTRETIQKELAEIAPDLSTLSNQTPYRLPEGYFNGLTETIINKATVSQSGKVRKLLIRWAAAACLTGLISIGVYTAMRNQQQQTFAVQTEAAILNELNTLHQNDLIAYLEMHPQPGDLLTIEKNLGTTVLSSSEQNEEFLLSDLLEDLPERL